MCYNGAVSSITRCKTRCDKAPSVYINSHTFFVKTESDLIWTSRDRSVARQLSMPLLGGGMEIVMGIIRQGGKNTSVLILAAGSGERFSAGRDIKKQFVQVAGIPAILRCAEAFESLRSVKEIIVVTGRDDIGRVHEILDGKITKLTSVVCGGATRQESAMAGLGAVSDSADYIAIHDAARCLVTPDVITRVIDEAVRCGAAAAAERAVDTVKYAKASGVVENTIDRTHVWLVRTPQVFKANMYRAGVYMAHRDGAAVTDDCMLVERLGFKVQLVDCGHENLKITYPSDLAAAEAILQARQNNI